MVKLDAENVTTEAKTSCNSKVQKSTQELKDLLKFP